MKLTGGAVVFTLTDINEDNDGTYVNGTLNCYTLTGKR